MIKETQFYVPTKSHLIANNYNHKYIPHYLTVFCPYIPCNGDIFESMGSLSLTCNSTTGACTYCIAPLQVIDAKINFLPLLLQGTFLLFIIMMPNTALTLVLNPMLILKLFFLVIVSLLIFTTNL